MLLCSARACREQGSPRSRQSAGCWSRLLTSYMTNEIDSQGFSWIFASLPSCRRQDHWRSALRALQRGQGARVFFCEQRRARRGPSLPRPVARAAVPHHLHDSDSSPRAGCAGRALTSAGCQATAPCASKLLVFGARVLKAPRLCALAWLQHQGLPLHAGHGWRDLLPDHRARWLLPSLQGRHRAQHERAAGPPMLDPPAALLPRPALPSFLFMGKG